MAFHIQQFVCELVLLTGHERHRVSFRGPPKHKTIRTLLLGRGVLLSRPSRALRNTSAVFTSQLNHFLT
uniref:Uncharacterized protein n=1 Tax=Helianthus annuus TaxID=4232 RepID=A0A251U4W3_HELAN